MPDDAYNPAYRLGSTLQAEALVAWEVGTGHPIRLGHCRYPPLSETGTCCSGVYLPPRLVIASQDLAGALLPLIEYFMYFNSTGSHTCAVQVVISLLDLGLPPYAVTPKLP